MELVGTVGVDAGLIWVGDPCYVLPEDASGNPGHDWDAFCAILSEEDRKETGYTGTYVFEAGICVSSGYGDGVYPVFVRKNSEGRVVELRVLFEEFDDYED